MTGFTPFQPHAILPAAALNEALQDVDNDALAAASGVAAATTEAGTAETTALAAETQAAAALAAAQAAGTGTVRSVNGVGPDGTGNVTVAVSSSSSSPALTRPAFGSFTDAIIYGGSPTWTDDGTALVVTGPTYNTSSSAAPVYQGKPVPAYNPQNRRTLTVCLEHDLPDAPGVKVGIAPDGSLP